jgi:lipopolysaccharide/colanic/teichoic acid biosynthesis glycosyltransferase
MSIAATPQISEEVPVDIAADAPPAEWCWSRGKRVTDIVLAIASLPIVIPLGAITALISAIFFRCNPLFVQERRGIDETSLRLVKIRSLAKSFPKRQGKHEISDHEFTGWCHFIRRTHLDELPQIFTIIGGSMSIVGPRPMIDEVIDELEPADAKKRSTVKPGLTGPWQISTMGAVALHDHPELDNHYVDCSTFRSDAQIIWWTFTSIFGRSAQEPKALMKRLGW